MALKACRGRVLHEGGDGVLVVFSETIHTGADQEAGAQFFGRTEEFVDVALVVADVDPGAGISQEGGGLATFMAV